MLVQHLFFSLMERLKEIEEQWTSASKPGKEKLRNEMLQLRALSDEILDHWLTLEEKITQFQQEFSDELSVVDQEIEQMSDEVAAKILKEVKNLNLKEGKDPNLQAAPAPPPPSSPSTISLLTGDAAISFRRGQGYYNLFMFKQASKHFGELLEREPDLDIGRMFLAYSYMMDGQFELARHHFHLLSETTDHRLFRAIALNALGCLMAGNGKWEEAVFIFEKAIDSHSKLGDPLFNVALVYMKLGQYGEAKKSWLNYVERFSDDWEALFQLSQCFRHEGNLLLAEKTMERIYRATDDPELLWQVGQGFEDLRQFGNAALCYQLLVNLDPSKASAWHGLGWNLYHAEGYPYSLQYIQKAISLAPKNPDFQFSYGWILFYMGEWGQAEKVFQHVLQQEKNYPLALAGLVQIMIGKEHWEHVKGYCNQLILDEQTQTRALGHFLQGKAYLIQGNYTAAEKEWKQSIRENPKMKDSYLMLGLVQFLKGEKEQAMECWEYAL
ncbi:tetratricopeptide repeat protein [Ammoniphilus resinae]|uniref:Tetratricopeptide (TPR) repeat protein n=1 Tax=Ammoniphilus resinae TaxID=861532 RepID=A0ABS4GT08_9BACL|nr:tetratricopeptide repeat protein [Ammoniphilus resinae]MBP1933406.1 tetratricopeptide (TPR) repeat protein [Ammoniphilus resinae]